MSRHSSDKPVGFFWADNLLCPLMAINRRRSGRRASAKWYPVPSVLLSVCPLGRVTWESPNPRVRSPMYVVGGSLVQEPRTRREPFLLSTGSKCYSVPGCKLLSWLFWAAGD